VEPGTVVRELFAAFAARDVDAVIARVDPAVEFWPQGTATVAGRAEPYRGHDGMREYMADVARVWRSLEVEPGDLRIAAGGVVAFGRAQGVRADGEEMSVPVIWTFKLAGDRVLSARVVATAAEAASVLGA
jgi:ketosteroid isomerase-like protein